MRVFGRSSTLGGPTIPYYTICCSELNFFSRIILNAFSLSSPPTNHPHNHRHDPARPGADRGKPPLFPGLLRQPPFQRPEPALILCSESHLRCSNSCRDGSRTHKPSRPAPPSARASCRSTSRPGSSRKTGLPGGLLPGHPGNPPAGQLGGEHKMANRKDYIQKPRRKSACPAAAAPPSRQERSRPLPWSNTRSPRLAIPAWCHLRHHARDKREDG